MKCSFCGRPDSAAGPLVPGQAGLICRDCTFLAADLLRERGVQMRGFPDLYPVREVQDVLRKCSAALGKVDFALSDEARRLADRLDPELGGPV